MTPMNGSSFGRAGCRLRRYPSGTENVSISATVRGSIPNRRAAEGPVPQRKPLSAPARTVPRLSSLRLRPFSAEGYWLPDFYSGAVRLSGRFTAGFSPRRLHPTSHRANVCHARQLRRRPPVRLIIPPPSAPTIQEGDPPRTTDSIRVPFSTRRDPPYQSFWIARGVGPPLSRDLL